PPSPSCPCRPRLDERSMKVRATFVAVLLSSVVTAAEPVNYTVQVKPLLAKNCFGCHGPDKQRASLRLDTAASIREGGDTGPAVVPGKSASSLLIRAVSGADGITAMPPK